MSTLALPTSPSWRLQLRRLLDACRSHLQSQRERAEFMQLDATALRDLGLHRSEYDSYRCEAEGDVRRTRRRLGHWR
ncbi:DUF1127 domain-containing protein [Roseateles sp. NT4]|uniref:DUF1127 domain-containing protein n=1 Tax=Roseateles sp. NT4 TaxID=3453715 RepID=UPI003EE96369